MDMSWYLLRTKAGEEKRALAQVRRFATDALLPLLKVRVRRWSRVVDSIAPLFPCYLFAQFDLNQASRSLCYTRGLRGIVCFGTEPAQVPWFIMRDLELRCSSGPIELPRRRLLPGEAVRVIDGPFQDYQGIFERELSGAERVAVLLSMMGREARLVLPAKMVALDQAR